MSTQKQRESTESKEIHTVQIQNVDKYFDEVDKTAKQYFKSITDLQEAYSTAWRNVVESVFSIQKEFARKAGISTGVPEAFIRTANDMTEDIIKAQTLQNEIGLAAINSTIQNIKTFNENAKTFTGLNQHLVQSWISAYTPTRNV